MRKAHEREQARYAHRRVDPDDAPELTDEFFEHADEYVGAKRVRPGRPKTEAPKLALTVWYDADVVEAFKATALAARGAGSI